MKITYSITKEDFWNYSKYIRFKTPRFKISMVFALLSWIMLPTGMFILFNSIKISLLAVMPVIIVHLLYLYQFPKYTAFKSLESNKSALDEQTLEITPEGISTLTNSQQAFAKWNVVNKIETTNKYIFIYFTIVSAIIIPKRIFNSESEAVEFYNEANNYFESNKNNS